MNILKTILIPVVWISILTACGSVQQTINNLEATTKSFKTVAEKLDTSMEKVDSLLVSTDQVAIAAEVAIENTNGILEQLEFMLYAYAAPVLILLIVLLWYSVKRVRNQKTKTLKTQTGLTNASG